MMDIFEVGTGGGSIARVEDGALRVGPQSAGAQPGPACYGLGGEAPTVTDANLVLGRIGADRFLGGEMLLDVGGAERASGEGRKAARHGAHRSRRRHPAHRRDRDVLRRQGGDHRARPRCGRLHALRLWRRGSAACRAGRARDRHPQRDHSRCARRVLRLRHAVLGSALRLRAHLADAARRRAVREDRAGLSGTRGRGQEGASPARRSRRRR